MFITKIDGVSKKDIITDKNNEIMKELKKLYKGIHAPAASMLYISFSKDEARLFPFWRDLAKLGFRGAKDTGAPDKMMRRYKTRIKSPFKQFDEINKILSGCHVLDSRDFTYGKYSYVLLPPDDNNDGNSYAVFVLMLVTSFTTENKEYNRVAYMKRKRDVSFYNIERVPVNELKKNESLQTAANEEKKRQSQISANGSALRTPSEIKKYLDQYVISQNEAKMAISVAVYNHYKRINSLSKKAGAGDIAKSNILIMGPTGTGKTEIIRNVAKLFNVPFASISAANLSATGYMGESASDVLKSLYMAAGKNIKAAERGIVFIDEIDKIAATNSGAKDVSGEEVQYELLRMLEGGKVSINITPGAFGGDGIEIDTSNILFVCAGAFSKMETTKESTEKHLGFIKSEIAPEKEAKDLTDKLEEYGIIPELVGRLQVITCTEKLTEADLTTILKSSKKSLIKQYTNIMKIDNVELKFEDAAINAIAHKAIAKKTGARALQSVVEHVMLPIMYKAPDIKGLKSVTVTEACINEGKEPSYEVAAE